VANGREDIGDGGCLELEAEVEMPPEHSLTPWQSLTYAIGSF